MTAWPSLLRPLALALCIACAGGPWATSMVFAQAEDPDPVQPGGATEAFGAAADENPSAQPSLGRMPSLARLAQALGDHAPGVLLDVAAAARLRDQLRAAAPGEAPPAAALFESNRDRLRQLVERFGLPEPRSPVLDAAAWRLRVQLDQLELAPFLATNPPGPGLEGALSEVYDPSNSALAAATLPHLLWYLETEATLVWAGLDAQLDGQAWITSGLLGDWAATGINEPGKIDTDPGAKSDTGPTLVDSLAMLAAEAEVVAGEGPRDPRRLRQLRTEWLFQLPSLDGLERRSGRRVLRLITLLEHLEQGRYLGFADSLLALVTDLDPGSSRDADRSHARAVADWLREVLPLISDRFGRAFVQIDPGLNTVLASAFEAARVLSSQDIPDDLSQLRTQLADSVARLALLGPDLGFYFDQPVRDPIAGGVDACTGISSAREADGGPAMTRELFDDCLQSIIEQADGIAREAQLSGDPNGPFGITQLRRELRLTPEQRINFSLGYLQQRFATGCQAPIRPLPNPLEWAYLSDLFVWFAEQFPVYFQTPDNRQRLEQMRGLGDELLRVLGEQADCMAGAGDGIADPVRRVTSDYGSELDALRLKLRSAAQEFRELYLAVGADLELSGGPDQATTYRPAGLEIRPCDAGRVCEMNGPLSSTRALVGLFPDPYLLADQSGLGRVEICYDRLGWEQRRSESVRPGDENVANYFGHLVFELRGRYRDENGARDLFAFRFESPQEHHYLFAAASAEILEDRCPMEWAGQRVVSTLPVGAPRIVPNRLTYLSAPRTLPSALLAANWDQGAEWRDWFVTGIGVQSLELPPVPDPLPELARHLQRLYRLEQLAIYGSLFRQNPPELENPLSPLAADLARLDAAKSMIRVQMQIFYPVVLGQDEPLRAALMGANGLLDSEVLAGFRAEARPLAEVLDLSQSRLAAFQQRWDGLPEALRRQGAPGTSVEQSLGRLGGLHRRFFSALPTQVPEASAAPLSGGVEDAQQGDTANSEL